MVSDKIKAKLKIISPVSKILRVKILKSHYTKETLIQDKNVGFPIEIGLLNKEFARIFCWIMHDWLNKVYKVVRLNLKKEEINLAVEWIESTYLKTLCYCQFIKNSEKKMKSQNEFLYTLQICCISDKSTVIIHCDSWKA